MNSINIEATDSTPAIKFGANGMLVIEGRSLRMYMNEFYKPLIDWVSDLRLESVTIDINLEYVDTSCSILLYHLLKQLDNNMSIKKLIVNWHYEEVDDDTLDDGMILKGILKRQNSGFTNILRHLALLINLHDGANPCYCVFANQMARSCS